MREINKNNSGIDRNIKNILKVSGVVVGFVFISSCSLKKEKVGSIVGSIGGVGSGYYMCENYGVGKFRIGCMVLGGLVGGVLGGELGENFDNKEIYNSVKNYSDYNKPQTYNRKDGSKMEVKIVDDYVEDRGRSLVGDRSNSWCKDFEFSVEKDGVIEKGKGKSCRDEFGKWEVLGIDLIR